MIRINLLKRFDEKESAPRGVTIIPKRRRIIIQQLKTIIKLIKLARLRIPFKIHRDIEGLTRVHGQTMNPSNSSLTRISERQSRIKILFLESDPYAKDRLRIDIEIREIMQKIRLSEFRDVLDITRASAVRPDDLIQALCEHRPHIVHFSGHGVNQTGEIVLFDKYDQPKQISSEALAAVFSHIKDNIKVVFFNSCFSAQQATALTKYVDCVVGMSDSVDDTTATIFAASFYRAIGFGRSVKEAVEQGKLALLLEGMPTDHLPVLLSGKNVDPSSVWLIDAIRRENLHLDRSVGTDYSKRDEIVYAHTEIPMMDENSVIDAIDNSFPEHPPPTSLIYCDIDGLLGINQVYGREIGDAVIQVAARIIKECADSFPTRFSWIKKLKKYCLTYRFRGDQFIMLLPVNKEKALAFANECQKQLLEHNWSIIAPDLYITCTFCVATRGDESAGRWLLRAIVGNKNSKKQSPNQVVEAPLGLPWAYEAEVKTAVKKETAYKKIIYYSSS